MHISCSSTIEIIPNHSIVLANHWVCLPYLQECQLYHSLVFLLCVSSSYVLGWPSHGLALQARSSTANQIKSDPNRSLRSLFSAIACLHFWLLTKPILSKSSSLRPSSIFEGSKHGHGGAMRQEMPWVSMSGDQVLTLVARYERSVCVWLACAAASWPGRLPGPCPSGDNRHRRTESAQRVKALVTEAATSLECVSGKEYPVSSSLRKWTKISKERATSSAQVSIRVLLSAIYTRMTGDKLETQECEAMKQLSQLKNVENAFDMRRFSEEQFEVVQFPSAGKGVFKHQWLWNSVVTIAQKKATGKIEIWDHRMQIQWPQPCWARRHETLHMSHHHTSHHVNSCNKMSAHNRQTTSPPSRHQWPSSCYPPTCMSYARARAHVAEIPQCPIAVRLPPCFQNHPYHSMRWIRAKASGNWRFPREFEIGQQLLTVNSWVNMKHLRFSKENLVTRWKCKMHGKNTGILAGRHLRHVLRPARKKFTTWTPLGYTVSLF